ncbi:glycosyltransferase family 2 protein [Simiduia agarivorans]|uniref:Cell wall biosynthesis glycosyltransferase-like protein n=1 Tax=Simiduia agarivorans (strain DSM 21679 / JCM 13881 / BCRC 17597 / SA1) TaxID=1117647 RepID=K4L0W6_SIMAS|nr:glycosyltransferase family 2 protein [Simiduia agarivorans]AFU99807.1 cell wall biosynthesis glycosyltransferase-like protein [Simiduia agarivorans SA1 = DSM 21679]
MRTPVEFSVVIPLYNKRDNIIETLSSVVQQTYAPLEVLVIDDGSTDGSAEIVMHAMETNAEMACVRLVGKANGGVSSARNLGIQLASGNMVAFMDADDSWEAHFLEEVAMLAQRYPNAVAYATNYQKRLNASHYVDPKIRGLECKTKPHLMNNYFEICAQGDLPFMTSSIAVPKAVLAAVGGFPEGEPMGEDQDMWSRLAMQGQIAYSPRVLAFYHLDAFDRACVRNVPKQECPFSLRLMEQVNNGRIPSERAERVLRYTATHLLHLARENIRAGDFDVAQQFLNNERTRLLPAKRWRCLFDLTVARRAAA